MVIVGVALEASELIVKWGSKKKFRKWIGDVFSRARRRRIVWCVKYIKPKILPYETLGFVLLLIGLAIELIGSSTAERMQAEENSQLELKNGLISLQVAQLTATNLELQAKLQPRIITSKTISDFIFLTEKIQKIEIKIHASQFGDDTMGFAAGIRDMLDAAKFKRDFSENGIETDVPNSGKPIVFLVRKVGSSTEFPWVNFVQYATNDLIYLHKYIPSEKTNGFDRPIVTEKDPKKIYEALCDCFNQLHIKSKWCSNPQLVAPGEFEIYVMSKNP